jgi:hypothetical protein
VRSSSTISRCTSMTTSSNNTADVSPRSPATPQRTHMSADGVSAEVVSADVDEPQVGRRQPSAPETRRITTAPSPQPWTPRTDVRRLPGHPEVAVWTEVAAIPALVCKPGVRGRGDVSGVESSAPWPPTSSQAAHVPPRSTDGSSGPACHLTTGPREAKVRPGRRQHSITVQTAVGC